MYGYRGTILRVNLTDQMITKEKLDLDMAKKFLGGRGLGTKLMMDEVDPNVEPLSPENKLMFVTGPLTGTPTPTGGRYMVVTKGPLTGTIASSNSGGKWGAELKLAGYDVIIFEGKSDKPVYLAIEDDKVELRDASHLWGKIVDDTTEEILKEMPEKTKVSCIGPAGEKLSLMACIMNDVDRAAGRTGVGAVMGSKNLKAIAVRGTGKVELADEEELSRVVKEHTKMLRENGVTGEGLPTYGSAVLVNIINESGILPVHNFQEGQADYAEEISGERMTEKYLKRKHPCYRCPIGCGRWIELDGKEGGGPEYETLWSFGSDCGVDNIEDIMRANFYCNELGIDTISMGATIAAAMELYELGYIKDEELDGMPLEFGNGEAMVEWTRRTCMREGFGDKMADGSYRLAESYGRPELSMSVNKQELPAYDPRGVKGQGLSYATSNRGGCHVRGYLISPEILASPEAIDRFTTEGKATWTKAFQDLTAVIDSIGLCLFTSFALGTTQYREMLNAATGQELTDEELLQAGDRIWNIERIFNLKAGIDPKNDTLPKRLLEDPMPEGPSKGHVTELEVMLPQYYAERGWTEEGIPTDETKEKLGLN